MSAQAKERNSFHGIRGSDLLCGFGIALNLTWCLLESHSIGFVEPLAQFPPFLNPRIFWLTGMLIISVLFLAFPQFFKQWDRRLHAAVPLLSLVGTVCFALSYRQDALDTFSLAAIGLTLSGMGYLWFVSRFVVLVSKTGSYARCVLVFVGAVLTKTALLVVIAGWVPFDWQVWITVLLPVANMAVLESARRFSAKEPSFSSSSSAQGGKRVGMREARGSSPALESEASTKGGRGNLVALVIMSALLFAIVRRLSFWGMWTGVDTALYPGIWQFSELIGNAAFLIPFACLVLIAAKNLPLAFRFQPAIIVVMAVLLFMSLDAGNGSVLGSIQFVVINIGESFAYVLYWSIVVLALGALDMPSCRTIGLGGLAFSLCSLFWVGVFGNTIPLSGVIILSAAYVVFIAMTAFSFLESRRTSKQEEEAYWHDVQILERDLERNAAALADHSLVSIIMGRCERLSKRYRLSPRETEIFCLLAQGRTRSYIQEELTLSDSTVKTHISHIYAKLGASGRQDMMDMVLLDPKVESSELSST